MQHFAVSRVGRLAGHFPLRGLPRMLFSSYAGAKELPSPVISTTRHGDRFHIDFDSFLEWQLWAFGTYEPNVAELLATLVRPGDTVVDVGANVGIHAVRLGKLVGPTGHVVAIEPAKDLAQRLSANVALNGLGNVTVVQAAADSGSQDFVTLHRPPPEARNRGRSSMVSKESLSGAPERVQALRVDDVVASLPPVRLLKIDIEGAELAALHGAEKTIDADRPFVICEVAVENADEVTTYLRGFGYRLSEITIHRARVLHRRRLSLQPLRTLAAGSFDVLAEPAG